MGDIAFKALVRQLTLQEALAETALTPLAYTPIEPTLSELAKLISHDQAFENTSTSVAASQMRNALNNLADTVQDPQEKKVCQ